MLKARKIGNDVFIQDDAPRIDEGYLINLSNVQSIKDVEEGNTIQIIYGPDRWDFIKGLTFAGVISAIDELDKPAPVVEQKPKPNFEWVHSYRGVESLSRYILDYKIGNISIDSGPYKNGNKYQLYGIESDAQSFFKTLEEAKSAGEAYVFRRYEAFSRFMGVTPF